MLRTIALAVLFILMGFLGGCAPKDKWAEAGIYPAAKLESYRK